MSKIDAVLDTLQIAVNQAKESQAEQLTLSNRISEYDTELGTVNAQLSEANDTIRTQATKIDDLTRIIAELQKPSPTPAPTPTPTPTPAPAKFLVLDALRFPDDQGPDGLPKLEIAYASEFWPSNLTTSTQRANPDVNYIKTVMVPKWKQRFPTLKLLAIDIEHWHLSVTNASDALAKTNMDKHLAVLQAIREAWPGIKLAYYGEIPVRDLNHLTGSPTENSSRTAAWKKRHDLLKPLWDAVDVILPSVYSIGATDDDETLADLALYKRYVEDMVAEARRMAPGKPVYPVMWIERRAQPNHTDTWPYDLWKAKLEHLFAPVGAPGAGAGADGAVLWSMAGGTPEFDQNAPYVRATLDFVRERGLNV